MHTKDRHKQSNRLKKKKAFDCILPGLSNYDWTSTQTVKHTLPDKTQGEKSYSFIRHQGHQNTVVSIIREIWTRSNIRDWDFSFNQYIKHSGHFLNKSFIYSLCIGEIPKDKSSFFTQKCWCPCLIYRHLHITRISECSSYYENHIYKL